MENLTEAVGVRFSEIVERQRPRQDYDGDYQTWRSKVASLQNATAWSLVSA